MNTPESVVQAINILNESGINYIVVGSLSSNLYGIPRSTMDADIVIESDDQIGMIRKRLSEHFRAEPQVGFETIGMSTKHLFYDRHSRFMLELFVLSQDDFAQERFRRRKQVEANGITIWYPTAEDVVIQKLRWGRLKDLADTQDVIKAQYDTLDWPYIRQWCERHGSTPRLETVLAEIHPA